MNTFEEGLKVGSPRFDRATLAWKKQKPKKSVPATKEAIINARIQKVMKANPGVSEEKIREALKKQGKL